MDFWSIYCSLNDIYVKSAGSRFRQGRYKWKNQWFYENQRNQWNSKNMNSGNLNILIFWISLISLILQKSKGFFTYIVPGENGFRPISHRCHLNCSIWTKSPCEIGRKVFPNWHFVFSLFFVIFIYKKRFWIFMYI